MTTLTDIRLPPLRLLCRQMPWLSVRHFLYLCFVLVFVIAAAIGAVCASVIAEMSGVPFGANALRIVLIVLCGTAVSIGIAMLVVHAALISLRHIAFCIRELADGNSGASIPFAKASGEIGDVARAAVAVRDVLRDAQMSRTSAVQALAEQRAAEESYRRLFETCIDGIYVTTPAGRLIDANPALATMLGYDSAEALIAAVADHVTESIYIDSSKRRAFQIAIEQDGFVRDFEYTVRKRNGDVAHLSDSGAVVRDEDGRIVRYEGMVRDITEQRRIEASATAARRMLQDIIDTVPAMINVKDTALRYVLMNRYQADVFGIKPQDAIGLTIPEIMAFVRDTNTEDRDHLVLATGRELGFYEDSYKDSTGAVRQWLVNKAPMMGTAGEVAYVVSVGLDIGDRKRTEHEVVAAKEAAEAALRHLRETQNSLIEAEKLAALGRLVAGVAHEVNNPVGISLTVASALDNRIARFADEIALGPVRRSDLSEFMALNRDAAQQLVSNLNRAAELVQSFKQVAADRSHSERRGFDLAVLTEQVVRSLKPTLRKRSINLALDLRPGLEMESYPGAIGQVLTNLFLNAVYHAFQDGGGTVTLTCDAASGGDVRMIIVDDGCGMSPDVRQRAFDPFFTTRRDNGGTGLGLHIVYSIVTGQLGGRVQLHSVEGTGTTVTIDLPRRAPGNAPRQFRSV